VLSDGLGFEETMMERKCFLSSGSPWPGRKNSIQRSFGRAEEYMMNPASSLRDGAWIEEEDFSGYWEGPGAPA
jgi:hypothetical protein